MMTFARKLPSCIDYKDGSYRVRITRRGFKVDQKFPVLEAAIDFRDRTMIDIRGHVYRDNKSERTTSLCDLLDRYLDERTSKKVTNKKQETNVIKSWQREPWAQLQIVSIRASHITLWRDRRVDEGKAPSTVSNAMNTLSKVYKIARSEWSLDVQNPCSGVGRPASRAHRVAPPSDYLEKLLVEKSLGSRAPWMAYAIRLASWSALRQSEVTALKWCDVDFDNFLITVLSEEERATKSSPRKVASPRPVSHLQCS